MRGKGRRRTSVWFWVFVAVVLVILLGLLFGGYRKGTKIGSLPAPATACQRASAHPGAIIPAWRTCPRTT